MYVNMGSACVCMSVRCICVSVLAVFGEISKN